MVKGIRDHQGIQEWREMRLFCCVMGGVFFLAFVGFEFWLETESLKIEMILFWSGGLRAGLLKTSENTLDSSCGNIGRPWLCVKKWERERDR